jgi:hypothetical protein
MSQEVIRLSTDDKPIIRVDKTTKGIISKKSDKEIIDKWFLGTTYTPAERDAIIQIMEDKGIYPESWAHDRELKSGLYPDIRDPKFSEQLYNKQEFYEARAAAISALEGTDPCNASIDKVFEVSPIQRLVSRFLNPATPYNGLLLYHGVGVGKTCSAIRVAEEFLQVAPFSRVFIIVPQAITAGFKRTIFDSSRLIKKNGKWSSEQCTGMIYPNLAMQELMKTAKPGQDFSVEEISNAVDKKIRDRYFRFGYLQFANWILKQLGKIPSHLTGSERESLENYTISKIFSDKLLIIDEAHNLRDTSGGFSMDISHTATDDDDEEDDPASSTDDHAGGKRLTPLLRRIVKYSSGMRLLLMSATPMYNKAAEISHLLNLLIVNDTKDTNPNKLIGDIFTKEGNLKPGGDIKIRTYSQRYVSYMRGENPYTFPLRLRPGWIPKNIVWPGLQKLGGKEVPIKLAEDDQNIINALPIVQVPAIQGSPIFEKLEKVLREDSEDEFKTETWVHLDISNIVYKNGLYGHQGWDSYFNDSYGVGDGMKYRAFTWKGDEDTASVDDIFGLENLKRFAPKMSKILELVQVSDGINFIYSRYVKAGILPIAIALERAGWTRVFNSADAHPLFITKGKEPKPSRQCAMCERKENDHKGISHSFVPACYVLLTGDVMLTPNFADILRYISHWDNDKVAPFGGRVKAILGSQVTTEGLDLKCIRSVHVLEPWYHLNRIEQIIGRAIRYCSHADLPMNLRNCLVYLYALTISGIETPDLHAYRISSIKAKTIGAVQRHMKISAMDCNINIRGLLIRDTGEGLPTRNIMDSERKQTSKYPLGDNKYSSTCDYLADCDYNCMVKIKETENKDIKTYTYSDAQKRLLKKEAQLKEIFSRDDIAYPIEEIRKKVYSDLPWEIVSRALIHILESPSFIIERNDGISGRLILQNGYLLFHPIGVRARQIPLAYRYSRLYKFLPRTDLAPVRGTILGLEKEVTKEGPTVPDEETTDPIKSFEAWMIAVDELLKAAKKKGAYVKAVVESFIPPASKASAYQTKAWGWLLYHFRDHVAIRRVAAQFWTERAWSAAERKEVLERIIKEGVDGFNKDIVSSVSKDIFKIDKVSGFKCVNPTANVIESYCYIDGAVSACASSFVALSEKKMGVPIDIRGETGDLFGFLVPRKDNTIVFKTLDKKGTKKIMGAVGSDCSVASDLTGHRGRIRDTQDAIRESAPTLVKYLIDDTDSSEARDEKGRAGRQENMTFKHVDDFSHIYVCMYMETLLRLLDIEETKGVRWFLNAVEAARAGLKGR